MTKQEQSALNMAKFIQAQTLLLLEKLNDLNLDDTANECELLQKLAERLHSGLDRKLSDSEENQETTE